MTTETNLIPATSAEAEGGAAVRVHPLVMPFPCPFCGCCNAGGMIGLDKTLRMSGEQRYYFRCFGCGTLGPDAHTQSEALEAWNRRHNDRTQPRRTDDMTRESGTECAIRRWL